LVRIKLLADDLQTRGGELLDTPCPFALRHPSLLVAEFLQRSTSYQKNKSNNSVIIIMFSITMLIVVQYSLNIQIQDLQIRNNMGVNEDYRLLGCKTMQLAMFWRT